MDRKLTHERRREIAERLMREGKVSASELSEQYGVSTETIRKDLLWLEDHGLAQRSYGGAMASPDALERSFIEKATDNAAKKRLIAQATVEHIPSGAMVLLDSGSTVLEVARKLSCRSDLRFFTNSLQAAQLLAEKHREVYVPGGRIRTSSQAITGAWAAETFQRINADIAILGASGFAEGKGPCVESMDEAEIKGAMIHSARQAILVADASKFNLQPAVRFAEWSEFSLLITDASIGAEDLCTLRRQIQVQLADREEETK